MWHVPIFKKSYLGLNPTFIIQSNLYNQVAQLLREKCQMKPYLLFHSHKCIKWLYHKCVTGFKENHMRISGPISTRKTNQGQAYYEYVDGII